MSNTLLQSVRGMHDAFGDTFVQKQRLFHLFSDLAKAHGFKGLETPIVESQGLFQRTNPDADIVTKEMFRLAPRTEPGADALKTEKDEGFVLRPEGTAPAMRALLQHGLGQRLPQRWFYAGPMFRYDRPQKGRLRQFHQLGLECFGDPHPLADVDLITCGYRLLDLLGLAGDVSLSINSLGCRESRGRFAQNLKTALQPFEKDLSNDSQRRLSKNPLRILDSKSPQDQKIVTDTLGTIPPLEATLSDTSQERFKQVLAGLDALSIPYKIDPTLVRGLDYYTETTFEFKTDTLGAQGTVLAGGRFDGLSEMLGGPPIPGIGWAAGVERLLLLAGDTLLKKAPKLPTLALLPIAADDQHHALRLASSWRESGFSVTLLLQPEALGKRMKKAATLGFTHTAILGTTERDAGTVQLKNLETGAQENLPQNKVPAFIQAAGTSAPGKAD